MHSEDHIIIRGLRQNNLKNVSLDIPKGKIVVFTGMTYIFDEPSTGMHPRDVYRMTRLLQSLRDKGNTVLVFMDPVTTVCEACEGKRYSGEALSYRYKGKSIVEILDMSAADAYNFFRENVKLRKALGAMLEVGLPYLSLGQPLSTLSGGERQRVKLAKYLDKKGNIYVLDEPTTGLHASDIKRSWSCWTLW